MSAEIQAAVINEAFELSQMFRQNAALKHGLPECAAAQRIKSLPDQPPPKQEPPIVNVINKLPAADAANDSPTPGEPGAASVPSSSLLRAAAPWLLTAVGAGGIAAGANYLMRDTPVDPPAAARSEPQDGSLLQWLQDRGQHLPEGDAWPTK